MTAEAEVERPVGGAGRLLPLDVLRGLVMVLMAIDHSSGEFNKGRLMLDGAFLWHAGTPLPAAQFLTRWITHLCAPTFVFLAGTSLSISIGRRLSRGERAASIDGHLFLRGLFIAACEVVPSFFWMPPGHYLLQVLYAIGTSFWLMIPLRRLPVFAQVAIAIGILTCGEAVTRALGWGAPDTTPLLAALMLVPGRRGPVIVAYPTLFWLAMMLLGFAFGNWLEKRPSAAHITRALGGAAAGLLATFLVVRGLNGYGNAGLLRDGHTLVRWLHVSKYPPSLSYVTLELGVAAAILATLFFVLRDGVAREHSLLLVLGRTPMFFYLLHIPVLVILAEVLHLKGELGLGGTYGFAALAVALLYWPCLRYWAYKRAHPNGVARYV